MGNGQSTSTAPPPAIHRLRSRSAWEIEEANESLADGATILVMGRSGCGKTALLHSLCDYSRHLAQQQQQQPPPFEAVIPLCAPTKEPYDFIIDTNFGRLIFVDTPGDRGFSAPSVQLTLQRRRFDSVVYVVDGTDTMRTSLVHSDLHILRTHVNAITTHGCSLLTVYTKAKHRHKHNSNAADDDDRELAIDCDVGNADDVSHAYRSIVRTVLNARSSSIRLLQHNHHHHHAG